MPNCLTFSCFFFFLSFGSNTFILTLLKREKGWARKQLWSYVMVTCVQNQAMPPSTWLCSLGPGSFVLPSLDCVTSRSIKCRWAPAGTWFWVWSNSAHETWALAWQWVWVEGIHSIQQDGGIRHLVVSIRKVPLPWDSFLGIPRVLLRE